MTAFSEYPEDDPTLGDASDRPEDDPSLGEDEHPARRSNVFYLGADGWDASGIKD